MSKLCKALMSVTFMKEIRDTTMQISIATIVGIDRGGSLLVRQGGVE